MNRVLTVGFALCLLVTSAVVTRAGFQQYSYTSPKTDFTIDLPSGTWRNVGEPNDVHQHTEFIYGDRNDGYLRIRKEALTEGTSIRDFALRDQDDRTRFLPGIVNGKDEAFNGRLDGVTLSYEFTEKGKQMSGRSYYVKADSHTVYVLRFTGLRQKLIAIRNQTDAIARSLQVK